MSYPYKIESLNPKLNQQLLEDFKGERTGFVKVDKKWCLPEKFREAADALYHFQPRSSDIWILTLPRSGTTLTQEMVWLLENNLDYDGASKLSLLQRFPFFEVDILIHPKMVEEVLEEHKNSPVDIKNIHVLSKSHIKDLEAYPGKRFIKSHLAFSLLSPDLLKSGAKVLYVARNPKDVVVSFYHLCRDLKLHVFQKDFSRFCYYYKNDLVVFNSYWDHIREGWIRRNENNVLFLFYENIVKDIDSAIKQVADFLGVQYSDQEYQKLAEHLKIDNFKKNDSIISKPIRYVHVNDDAQFVRNGQVGGWKNYFVGEINEEADEWIEENSKKIGIQFPTF